MEGIDGEQAPGRVFMKGKMIDVQVADPCKAYAKDEHGVVRTDAPVPAKSR